MSVVINSSLYDISTSVGISYFVMNLKFNNAPIPNLRVSLSIDITQSKKFFMSPFCLQQSVSVGI